MDEGGLPPRLALCRGRHLEGQKYGIIKFGCFWRIGVCIAGRIHPQLSVLFTVHTNAIVVTIRISIGDLIAGVGATTKTFAPGGKHPHAATATLMLTVFDFQHSTLWNKAAQLTISPLQRLLSCPLAVRR